MEEWTPDSNGPPSRKPAKGQMSSVYRVSKASKLKLDIDVFK